MFRSRKLWIIFTFFTVFLVALFIVSIPRHKHPAFETGAIGSLKTVWHAQDEYYQKSNPHSYAGSLACLGSGNGAGGKAIIDPALEKGLKAGYKLEVIPGPTDEKGAIHTWSCTAWPVVYSYKLDGIHGWLLPAQTARSFYIDETGSLKHADNGGKPGTADMPEIK